MRAPSGHPFDRVQGSRLGFGGLTDLLPKMFTFGLQQAVCEYPPQRLKYSAARWGVGAFAEP